MKIICTKAELAQMLTRCVENSSNSGKCYACPLHEQCDGAYIDTLTAIIEIREEAKEE